MTDFHVGQQVKIELPDITWEIVYLNSSGTLELVPADDDPRFPHLDIDYIPVEFVKHVEDPSPDWFPPREGDIIKADGVEYWIRQGTVYSGLLAMAGDGRSHENIKLHTAGYLKAFAQRDLELIRRR